MGQLNSAITKHQPLGLTAGPNAAASISGIFRFLTTHRKAVGTTIELRHALLPFSAAQNAKIGPNFSTVATFSGPHNIALIGVAPRAPCLSAPRPQRSSRQAGLYRKGPHMRTDPIDKALRKGGCA
jgi:hypothetical protein